MKTCETCKYWNGENQYGSRSEKDFRICEYTKEEWDCFDWLEDGDTFGLIDKYKNQKAVVVDGSTYYAALKTKADFGCNQHKEKQNDTMQ